MGRKDAFRVRSAHLSALVVVKHASASRGMNTTTLSAAAAEVAARKHPAQPGKPALEIRAAHKVFDQLEVIRDMSFDVGDGEFLSLLGPSGCGKSTLLMMIAGLTSASAGKIWINGTPVTGPRRETGLVFQSPVLLPRRSVLGNILLPIELLGLPRAKYELRAHELLRMAKIDDFADALPPQLSGGMKQRAAICRALVHEPNLLLMDEPFSALDAVTRDGMGVELLRIWQAYRKTVVFVTHSIREAAFLSDRVLVMGARPATIIDCIDIDLPRPRPIAITEDEAFNRYVRLLRKAIEASHAG
jgi:NitT/TauT family transport system ATP-binding protein